MKGKEISYAQIESYKPLPDIHNEFRVFVNLTRRLSDFTFNVLSAGFSFCDLPKLLRKLFMEPHDNNKYFPDTKNVKLYSF